ncbi:branched-chain amino acid ABC transporter substrate-binding protein [Burkholderia plantarii]|uniref:Putative periplasmic substrate-binding protein n=1 Tax=Burkholderia plantarii TaxID=41899 RepID=A0A0B6RXT4_BURPL|nr:branched-chain amino acid ABC transporter substrate-binding protein [Burkholderia plantarii]AJK50192.1 putative periplasmic substrate-binding protein [Burkholderia plantarii]ALK34350.1 branched chain amino acid ABC transporter substrate-binding protein [Burkholderia plantarii]WLE63396.1 branched-chain amino acid ABC transporter substrate-binding protein [Burkholderia plantarii]GLZ22138.1 branched chain amino acid ABC transporter substrate-binding protein [Burkholderia plantarii]
MRHLSIALAGAVAFGAVAAHAQEVVVIGHSAPLTGPQAANGKDNENGARLAVDELNKQHVMVAGKAVTFKLDSQDDQADPKVGVQVAQNLVDHGVVAVLGPYNSGVAIPASRVYSGAGVPLLPVASNPALTQQGFTNIFRIGASDEQLGGTMAEFAVKTLKAKTAAIIDDRTAYGQGVAQQFEKVAKASGLTIVDHQFTNSQATDFLGILTAIKAENPDVIFFGGYAAQGAPMAKQMRQRGLRAKLLGGDGICSADMGKVAGDAASIVYCAQGGVALEKTARGRDFLKKYQDAYHTPTQVYGVNYYDGVKMLADAMVKAGTTTDKAKLTAQLAREHYQGVAGTYSFDARGDLQGAPTTVYVIKDGLPVPYAQ